MASELKLNVKPKSVVYGPLYKFVSNTTFTLLLLIVILVEVITKTPVKVTMGNLSKTNC